MDFVLQYDMLTSELDNPKYMSVPKEKRERCSLIFSLYNQIDSGQFCKTETYLIYVRKLMNWDC